MIFLPNHTTFMDAVVQDELREFSKRFDPSHLTIDQTEATCNEGVVLYKTLPNRNAFQQLLSTYRNVQNFKSFGEIRRPMEHNPLFGRITRNIYTLTAPSLKESLQLIANIQHQLGDLFYGALISKAGKIINPMHPLVALAIIDGYMDRDFRDEVQINIYAYPDESILEDMKDTYYDDLADNEKIETNINNLILTYSNRPKGGRSKVLASSLRGTRLNVSYKVQRHPDEERDFDYYIVPCQMLVSGVVLPWYGTTALRNASRRGDGSMGIHLAPFYSCNVGFINSTETNLNTPSTMDRSVRFDWGSVCTGNSDNRTIEGMRTLIHANLGSPYHHHLIAPGALSYAKACIMKSLQIFEMAEFITHPANLTEEQPNGTETETE